MLGKDIFFRFIVPPVLKEKHSSKKVTILTDINERGIYRAETSLSSLKTQILLVNQMTENDKKKAKQDKETKICSYSPKTCSYSPIAFLHKYQHKVQSPRAEELSTKDIKDGNMDVIFCNQYAWTDSMIEVPNKIIINDIFTPFTLFYFFFLRKKVKEALIDSPLFIIKESNNCGNFLNSDRFNFLTDRINYRINYNPPINFPINKRLYKETLFHMFSQGEIYSNTYMDRIILDFKNILNLTYFDRLYHDCSNTTITQQEHKSVQRDICFIIYTLYYKNNIFIKHFKKTLQTDIDRKLFSTKALQEDIYFQNHITRHNLFPKTELQTTMSKRTS